MYAHAHVVLSQEPGRDLDPAEPGRALPHLPEPRAVAPGTVSLLSR